MFFGHSICMPSSSNCVIGYAIIFTNTEYVPWMRSEIFEICHSPVGTMHYATCDEWLNLKFEFLWTESVHSDLFQGIMILLQNLPTQSWGDREICELTADAYSLQAVFDGASKHLTNQNSPQWGMGILLASCHLSIVNDSDVIRWARLESIFRIPSPFLLSPMSSDCKYCILAYNILRTSFFPLHVVFGH